MVGSLLTFISVHNENSVTTCEDHDSPCFQVGIMQWLAKKVVIFESMNNKVQEMEVVDNMMFKQIEIQL